jgi:hypothetical protein
MGGSTDALKSPRYCASPELKTDGEATLIRVERYEEMLVPSWSVFFLARPFRVRELRGYRYYYWRCYLGR